MKKTKLIALLMLFSLLLPITVFAKQESATDVASASDVTPARDNNDDSPTFPTLPPETAPETAPETLPETSEPSQPPVENKVTLVAQTELRAGEIAIFHLRLTGTNARAIQGGIQFDGSQITLEECKTLAGGWSLNFTSTANSIEYLGLNTMNEGLTGENDLIALTFRVSKDIPTDAGLTVNLTSPTVYDGASEVIYQGESAQFSIAPPFSTDCTLSQLQVEGGTIFPAFAPDITEYSMTLPFSVDKANITAVANDSEFASVTISNTSLAVGTNYVEITVVSQAGNQQTYLITINRSTDPNYIPSADNRILALTHTEGLLFPKFSPDITKYTLYLVRGQEVSLYPIPANKAVSSALHIPDDTEEIEYTLVCNAENGDARVYTFQIVLFETPKQLEKLQKEKENQSTLDQVTLAIYITAGVSLFFLGFVFGSIVLNKRKKMPVVLPTPSPTPPSPPPSPDEGVSTDPSSEQPHEVSAETNTPAQAPAAEVPTESPTTAPTEANEPQPDSQSAYRHHKGKKKRKH